MEARSLDSVEDFMEARRYLGKYAVLEVTNIRGEIIVPAGTQIDDEYIRKAREAGQLSALIYSAKPSLIGNVDATEALINSTAHHINSSECSSSGSWPNNLYGYGFVDAARAVRP